jgi:hypothetical protein
MVSLNIRRNKIQALDADRQMFRVAGMKQMRTAYIIFIPYYECNGIVGKLWRIPQDNIKTDVTHWTKGKRSVSSGRG